MIYSLLDPDCWRRARRQNMIAARACRDVLTNPEGYWRLASSDKRVTKAVQYWVARARYAHALALGWMPVISNLVVMSDAGIAEGAAYVAGLLVERPRV